MTATTAALEVAFREQGTYGNNTHITMEELGTIPVEVVANMLGQSGEIPGDHRNMHGQEWEDFKADLTANGMHYGIFICVEVGEPIRIWEGNHRRDAAVELGWDEIPVQIRYFGHAEKEGTLLERWERRGVQAFGQRQANYTDYNIEDLDEHGHTKIYRALVLDIDWNLPDGERIRRVLDGMRDRQASDRWSHWTWDLEWTKWFADNLADANHEPGRFTYGPQVAEDGFEFDGDNNRTRIVIEADIDWDLVERDHKVVEWLRQGMDIPEPELLLKPGARITVRAVWMGKPWHKRGPEWTRYPTGSMRVVARKTPDDDVYELGNAQMKDWAILHKSDAKKLVDAVLQQEGIYGQKFVSEAQVHLYGGMPPNEVSALWVWESPDYQFWPVIKFGSEEMMRANVLIHEVAHLINQYEHDRPGIGGPPSDGHGPNFQRIYERLSWKYLKQSPWEHAGWAGISMAASLTDGIRVSKMPLSKDASVDDYGSSHQPPEDGAPLHDLIGQFPDDVYERPDLYDHTGGTSLADRDSAEAIRRYRGKPNDRVTIYRAVPPGVTEIETGNWVTLSEQYALDHSYQFGDDVGHWPILSASVPVHTVRNGGNDIVEWGYWGPTITNARRVASKTASAFQPSLVASWGSTRPWDASRADLEAQRVPGFRVGNARGTESASFEGGFIVLKEQWFTYEADTRRAICYHEAGHGLETAADYAEIAKAFGVDNALDIIDLPGAQRFGYNPDEIVAQAYSVLWTEPEWATFDGGPEILAAVARLAQAHGYPLPSGARTARWAGATPERDLVLYHGTSLANARVIAQEGFLPLGSHVNVWTWYTLTTSKDQAARYAQGDGPQAVVEFTIPAGTEGILGKPASHGAYDFEATAYGVVNPIPASMVTAVIPLPERRTASSSGPIYRGFQVKLPADLMAKIQELAQPPTTMEEKGRDRQIGRLVVDWLQDNEWQGRTRAWNEGLTLGRHWTTRKEMAETAAIQGGTYGGLGIILTATYDPADVDHEGMESGRYGTPGMLRSESEVTLKPGAPVTIVDVEFVNRYDLDSKWITTMDGPIRATASITTYYHGTTADLPPGTILVPRGEKSQARGDRYVHFSTDLDTAFVFAGANGDVGHVYEVEPIGEVQKWRFNEFSYRAPQARILREVSLPKTASAPARLFHGTPHELPIGTILVPGGPDGTLEVGGHQGPHKFVWMADTVAGAKGWGEHYTWNDDGKTTTRHPGHIYEVEPIGECWQPPAFAKGDYRGPIGSAGCWVAPQARIIAEVGPRGGRIKPTAARPHPDAIIEKDGYLTYAFSMADTGLSGVVEVYDGSLQVGTLLFMDREGNGTAVVEGVEVHPAYRREGIATKMLGMARRLWHGEEIIHSTTLTEDGAAWSTRVGDLRTIKRDDAKRRLSLREVERKCREIVDAVGREHGVDLSGVFIDLDADYIPSDARYIPPKDDWRSKDQGSIAIHPRTVEEMRDPELGVSAFRIVSHEAVHAVSSIKFTYEGFTHDFEEGAAEILSLWHWAKEGQEFGKADAYRDGGKWIEGVRALVHRSAYPEQQEAIITRAAALVGWNPKAIAFLVRDIHTKDDSNARIEFMQTEPARIPASVARYETPTLWLIISGDRTSSLQHTALADGDKIREHLGDLDLPTTARDGDCIWVSGAVAKALKEHGWDAEVEQVTGWDYLMGHKVVVFVHMVVRIGDTIVDASATQYDASLPSVWVIDADEYLNELAEATGVMQVTFGMSATGVNYDALARSEA